MIRNEEQLEAVLETYIVWLTEIGDAPEFAVLEPIAEYAIGSDSRFSLLRYLLQRSSEVGFRGERERAVWIARTLQGFGNALPASLDLRVESTAQHLPVQDSVSA